MAPIAKDIKRWIWDHYVNKKGVEKSGVQAISQTFET
jgi:hypothetical protein